jgi:tetratricopeptide (TPR) repeat protein
MKKELKRQIKQDELVTGIDRALGWLRTHQREAKVTAAIVIAVLVGGLAVTTYKKSRARAAEFAFASALETFHAPLASEAPPPQGGGKSFATAAERARQAAQEFAEVHRQYGSQAAGVRARYYEGLSRMQLGQTDEAHKALSDVAARRGGPELTPELARLALADLELRRGRVDQALTAYRQMVDDATLGLPRDHVLMVLSAALEQGKRLGEARAAYQRLADEFPGSVYAAEARRRADYLTEPATS